MSDALTDNPDAGDLLAEIGRLRGQVAELRAQVDRLDLLAHQDSLMDLPNRRGFRRELDRLIARTARYGGEPAMLYVDVNDLKHINDSFGHGAGDAALVTIAQVLAKGLRKSDFIGRIGGDEIGILLEEANSDRASETAKRLCALVAAAKLEYAGAAIPLSVSIGAGAILAGDEAEAVMARADTAMYRDKAAA